MYIFGNRYCKDAVDSVEIVTACPTSKTGWKTAALKKNCGRIASRQKCDSVERFKYHCVINGFRNEMVEVCAPSRIIFGKINKSQKKYHVIGVFLYKKLFLKVICIFLTFLGHCVEFNVRGGVIQDQISTPCNDTFPKCDLVYNSSDAYKCKVTEVHITYYWGIIK